LNSENICLKCIFNLEDHFVKLEKEIKTSFECYYALYVLRLENSFIVKERII